MREDKNTLEMGLMNISDVLYNIFMETESATSILTEIKDVLIDNFKKFHTKANKKVTDIPKQNKTFFKGFRDSLKNAFTFNNVVGKTHKKPSTFENQYNIYFDKKLSDKAFKSGAEFFDKLHRLASLGQDKLKRITEFFKEFDTLLIKIKPTLWNVGAGIGFITLSLLALNFVSLLSIMKMIVLLPAIGVAFGLFVGMITRAISGVGFFKAFIVLHQIPAIFMAMGKSILFLSIGLLLFDKVGWGAMVKMTTAMLFLSVVFSRFLKGGVGADFMVLISLGLSIFFLAKALKGLENIEWESIAKMSVFLMSLSFALNLLGIGQKMGSKSNATPLLLFSISLISVSIALNAMSIVSWMDVFKLNVFIVGLGVALRLGGFSKVKISPLSMLGIGILALSLALMQMAKIDVLSLVGVIGVIALLGLVIAKVNGSKSFSLKPQMGAGNMLSFAFGLGLMTLAMFALAEVPIVAMMKTIGFIVALGLAIRVFNGGSKLSGLPAFAFGLGLMVLAILAFDELPLMAMVKTIGFVIALGLAIKVFNGDKKTGLLGFSFALGLMVLAIYAMDELPFWAMTKTLLFIGALILMTKLINPKALLPMLGLTAVLLAVSYAFKKVGDANISWEQLAKFGTFIVGFGVIMAIVGIPAVSALIALGSIVTLLMMATVLLGAYALKKVGEVNINFDQIWDFMLSVGTLAIGFAIIAIPAVLGLVGALLFIPIALSALLGAEALNLISNYQFNEASIDTFMYGVKALSLGFFNNGLAITGAVIPAGLFLVVAFSAFFGAITLNKISNVTVNETKINKFTVGVQLLVKMYDKFGVIQMGKTALKAGAMLPILGVTFLSALVLQKINKLEISKSKISAFGDSFETLITVMSDTIQKQKDKLKDIRPALKAVAEIVNVASKLAVVVQQMADMRFNEYDVKNGKLVLVGQRVLKKEDFEAVGTNIGTLVKTLLDPIAELGGNSDSFTIGNMVVANPFKSNKHLKGIDTIKRMGDAYLPLSTSIKNLAESDMYDAGKATLVTANMMSMINIYSAIFTELETPKFKNANKSITEIIRFNELMGDINTDKMDKFKAIGSDLIEKFSDTIKWKNIRYNFTYMRKEVEAMVKSINSLNLDKAKIFESNIKLLVEKGNARQLAEVLQLLRELIGLSVEHNTFVQQQSYNQNDSNVGVQTVPTNANPNAPIKGTIDTKKPEFDMNLVVDKLEEINTMLGGINQKVGGVLKVKNVGASNAI